jgi:hypothetical protein
MAILRKSSAMLVTINAAEQLIDDNIEMREQGLNPNPLMFIGAPGIGKSEMIRHVAAKHDMEVRAVNIANMAKEDVNGMPLPFNMGTSNPTLDYVPNNLFVFPDNKEKKYMLFLDELTNAPEDVQAVCLTLLLERRLNNYTLPDNVFVVAAGNRMVDKSRTYNLIGPAITRLAEYELKSTPAEWTKWGRMYGNINPKVLAFIDAYPTKLHAMYEEEDAATGDGKKLGRDRAWYSTPWYCHRTVTAASRKVDFCEKKYAGDEENFLTILKRHVAGDCGEAWADAFIAFYHMAGAYDNVREIMLDPTKSVTIPHEADKKCALAVALTFNLWQASNDAEQEQLIKGFYRISMSDGMPVPFAIKIFEDAVLGNSRVDYATAGNLLTIDHHDEFVAWSKKYRKDKNVKL